MKHRKAQNGLTLIELMVAMVLGLLLVLAATAALVVARRSFVVLDAASQLRDNARYSVDTISRIVAQGGFEDLNFAISTRKNEDGTATNPLPSIYGFNNALVSASDPAGTAGGAGGAATNGNSDVLIVRYQAGETFTGSGVSDGTMIDCQGNAASVGPTNRDDRMFSVFHVAVSNGELSLMCTTLNGTVLSTVPMVQGVENFQVLYGVDGVIANTAPSATLAKPSKTDRYLRADQLTVASDLVGTYANWRRVNSIRIGMVLRAAANTAQANTLSTIYAPFGPARSAASTADGSALSSSGDLGTTPGVIDDGRLRQVATFTIFLRNAQDLSNPL